MNKVQKLSSPSFFISYPSAKLIIFFLILSLFLSLAPTDRCNLQCGFGYQEISICRLFLFNMLSYTQITKLLICMLLPITAFISLSFAINYNYFLWTCLGYSSLLCWLFYLPNLEIFFNVNISTQKTDISEILSWILRATMATLTDK